MKRFPIFVLLLAVSLRLAAKAPLVVGIAEERRESAVNVPRSYIQALERVGHVPLIIPAGLSDKDLRMLLKKVDMVLFPGGEDVNPSRYETSPSPQLGAVNDERDAYEWQVMTEAIRLRKPIMGICRGMQMINVYLGGSLYQDLPSEYPDTSLHHRQSVSSSIPTHLVIVSRTSRLFAVTGQDTLRVNSSHHQAVRRLAPGLRIAARATDGVIEAVECDSLPIAGVQFHPERLAVDADTIFTRLFRELKKFCKR